MADSDSDASMPGLIESSDSDFDGDNLNKHGVNNLEVDSDSDHDETSDHSDHDNIKHGAVDENSDLENALEDLEALLMDRTEHEDLVSTRSTPTKSTIVVKRDRHLDKVKVNSFDAWKIIDENCDKANSSDKSTITDDNGDKAKIINENGDKANSSDKSKIIDENGGEAKTSSSQSRSS